MTIAELRSKYSDFVSLSDAYGQPRDRMLVRSVEGADLSESAYWFWQSIVQEIDYELDATDLLSPDCIRRVLPKKSQIIPTLLDEAAKIVAGSSDTHVVSIFWGAFPQHIGLRDRILDRDGRYGSAEDRMHTIRFQITDGTGAGSNQTKIQLPDSAAKSKYLVYHDEIVDSALSLATVLKERLVEQGRKISVQSLERIMERITGRERSEPFSVCTDEYKLIAVFCDLSGTLVAVPFYKNTPLHQALWERALCSESTDWAYNQARLLCIPAEYDSPAIPEEKSSQCFSQTDWLMGEGLDTAVKGSDLAGSVSHAIGLRNLDPGEYGERIEELRSLELSVGRTVSGLIALNPDRQDEFFHWLGERIADQLIRFSASSTITPGRENGTTY